MIESAHPLPLLQILLVVLAAKGCGALLRRFGQPAVVGELVAGFTIGPAVLGSVLPEWHAALFDPGTRRVLAALGELGLVLFVFVIGAEFTAPARAGVGRRALGGIATGSIVVPFALGAGLALVLHGAHAPPGAKLLPFVLFIATVTAVTAFPVLAALLRERGLLRQPEGVAALFSAAVGDLLVWVMLAAVVVLHVGGGGWTGLGLRFAALLALALLCVYALRPLLARALARAWRRGSEPMLVVAVLVTAVLVFAAVAERLGVHPAIGAFLFGACLPRDEQLRTLIGTRVEGLVTAVLLPCFFAVAGLQAVDGSFAGSGLQLLVAVTVIAVVGKVCGAMIGARLAGWSWHRATSVGVLVNARGLMEIVALKIGLDMGLIGGELFTVFFVMAIATTVMTGPLLDVLERRAPVAAWRPGRTT